MAGSPPPLDRRTLLLAALGSAGAVVLGSCASDAASTTTDRASGPTDPTLLTPATSADGTAPSTTAPATTAPATTAPATTVPTDPALPYWMQGNFAPVDTEVEAFDLEITGALPPELDGLYVRNGSNPAYGSTAHWFLGDGMVHGVRLRAGRAEWYRNRWVSTPMLGKDLLAGDTGLAPGGPNNSSNTSVIHHAGKLLSLQEIGWPYELSTDDLSTIGATDLGGTLTTAMTAHPKVDPRTGLVHAFGYGFVPPYLTYFVIDATGAVVHSTEVPVAESTMIHDFAITDRDVIFWVLPVVFSMDLALANQMPFRWEPSHGAQLGIMPLGGAGTDIRWVDIDPCYVFHGTNAWRDGDDVVLDVSVQPTAFAAGGDHGINSLQRWRLASVSTGTPSFSADVIATRTLDLPTIDRRRLGTRHLHAWYATTRETPAGFEFAGISHYQVASDRMDTWDPGPSMAAGEGLFVPASADASEGEGWVLVYVYDATRDASDLVVLDALDCAAGPVARVHLPQRVPFGFHACWVDGSSLA